MGINVYEMVSVTSNGPLTCRGAGHQTKGKGF